MRAQLIRHGKTIGNIERRYIGSTDVPLCDMGREEAGHAKKDLSVRTVYVSPLRRARETAAILFPNAAQIVVKDLREMDFGDFEGRTADEMEHDPAYRAWVEGMCRGACPNGESMPEFCARVSAAFAKTLETAEGDPIFVAHGGVLMAVMSAFAEQNKEFYGWPADNLGGYAFDVVFRDGEPVLTNLEPVQY